METFINKCPQCAQLVHYEVPTARGSCWNCGAHYDFWTPQHREMAGFPGVRRLMLAAKVAMVFTLPFVAIMMVKASPVVGTDGTPMRFERGCFGVELTVDEWQSLWPYAQD